MMTNKKAMLPFLFLLLFLVVVMPDQVHPNKAVYSPIKPKETQQMSPQQTKDWDFVYRLLNKVGNSNLGSGIRRSMQNVSGLEVLGSLWYGLSMAAGLALGVSMADSNIISALSKRVDHKVMNRKNQLDRTVNRFLSSLPLNRNDKEPTPVLQKYVAPAKDGKDHYHHVVHYHVPYPLSVGALETARQNFPHISWYSSHSPGSDKSSVLSGYLGPMYKPEISNPPPQPQQIQVSQPTQTETLFVPSGQVMSLPSMMDLAHTFTDDTPSNTGSNLRRNDLNVYTGYFKGLDTNAIKTPVKLDHQNNNLRNKNEKIPSTPSPLNHIQDDHQQNFDQVFHHLYSNNNDNDKSNSNNDLLMPDLTQQLSPRLSLGDKTNESEGIK